MIEEKNQETVERESIESPSPVVCTLSFDCKELKLRMVPAALLLKALFVLPNEVGALVWLFLLHLITMTMRKMMLMADTVIAITVVVNIVVDDTAGTPAAAAGGGPPTRGTGSTKHGFYMWMCVLLINYRMSKIVEMICGLFALLNVR